MRQLEETGAWPARVLWVLLAATAGACVSDAIDGRSGAVRAVVLAGLWLGWTGGLVSLLVPRTTSLTAMRILVPAGAAAMVACSAAGQEVEASDLAPVAFGALAAAAVLTPWVGEAWADGSSYGAERRFLLRPPVLFSVVLVPLTWALVVLGVAVGPLLLAAAVWAPGVLATVAGLAAAIAGTRALHQLSRRWIVLVPTGLVVHDPLTMPEPQLVLRTDIARLGPALDEGSERCDLTGGAPGLALELDLRQPLELLVRTRGRASSTTVATGVMFTASRPRHLLDAAADHRLPVG